MVLLICGVIGQFIRIGAEISRLTRFPFVFARFPVLRAFLSADEPSSDDSA